jgi:hypothetical protein
MRDGYEYELHIKVTRNGRRMTIVMRRSAAYITA